MSDTQHPSTEPPCDHVGGAALTYASNADTVAKLKAACDEAAGAFANLPAWLRTPGVVTVPDGCEDEFSAFFHERPTRFTYAGEWVNDALIYGTLNPELLDRPIEIALSAMGSKTIPGRWKNWSATVRDLLGVLSQHAAGEKDGNCFLGGAVIEGERKAQAIRHMDLLTLDLDTGENIDTIRARLQRLGLFGVIYTTHSHLKPTTSVKKDAVIKWIGEKRVPIAADVCNYLRDVKRYQPAVLAGAEIAETEHTKEGVQIVLRHQPMAKFRVVLLLKERFVFAEANVSQADAIVEWKERYAGASKLLGAFFDRSCVDPSRLFYTPRHPAGASEYRVEVVAGRALDINEVERITANDLKLEAMTAFERAAHDATKDGQWKTTSLKWFFAKYGERFEIADFFLEMDGDGDRGPRPGGAGRVHRCPNDDQHTNAGEESDVAFIVVNSTESENGKAVALCRHDACANLDRIDFTDMICQRVGITDATELKKWVPAIEGDDEDEDEEAEPEAVPNPEALKPFKNAGEAKRAIAAMTENDEEAAIQIARRIGMSDLSPIELSALVKLLAKRSGVLVGALRDEVKEAQKKGRRKGLIDDETLERLAGINKKYALIFVDKDGLFVRLAQREGDKHGLLRREAFALKLAPEGEVEYGERRISLADYWTHWPERRVYDDGMVFEPTGGLPVPASKLNLWTGFPIKGKQGDWSLMQAHILDNVCQSNQEHYDWLLTWMAQIFQQPGVKLGSAVVVAGKKGAGKSKVFKWLYEALGGRGGLGITVANRKMATGNFNKHKQGKLLIVYEEAFFAGDHDAEGMMKTEITDDAALFESKGVDAIEMSDYGRRVFISNADRAVPADLDGERRYFVLECGDKHLQDTAYFAALDKEMQAGGMEAMIYDLKAWKLPNGWTWDILRKPPKTDALRAQADEGLSPGATFFRDLVLKGRWDSRRVHADGIGGDDKLTWIALDQANETDFAPDHVRLRYLAYLEENGIGHGPAADRERKDGAMWRYARRYAFATSESKRQKGATATQRCMVFPALKSIRAAYVERGMAMAEDFD